MKLEALQNGRKTGTTQDSVQIMEGSESLDISVNV